MRRVRAAVFLAALAAPAAAHAQEADRADVAVEAPERDRSEPATAAEATASASASAGEAPLAFESVTEATPSGPPRDVHQVRWEYCQRTQRPAGTYREGSAPYLSPLAAVAIQYGVGVAAAAITIPVMILIGNQLQSTTGDLVGSMMLSALPYAVVVPLAITGTQSLVANRLQPGSGYGGWAAAATATANIGMMVVGHAMGVSPMDAGSLVGFTAINALVLPAISAAVMYAASPRPCDRAAQGSACAPRPQLRAGGAPYTDRVGAVHLPLLGGTF